MPISPLDPNAPPGSASFVTLPGFPVHHAFSTRLTGVSRAPFDSLDLSLAPVGSPRAEEISENARRLAGAIGISPEQIAAVSQVHGTRIIRVEKSMLTGSGILAPIAEADGMVTAERGIALSIRTADCVPVLIASVSPDRPAIAAVHAGWRGTIGLIAPKAVEILCRDFGLSTEDLTAAIGPAIGRCCYEVSRELADDFIQKFGSGCADLTDAVHPHLNLKAANRTALIRAGLSPEKIHVSEHCTSCESGLFFSHRRDRGQTGRQMSLIWM